jgi:hypothetical protein
MNYSKFTVKISVLILLASAIMAFAFETRGQDLTITNTNTEGAGTYKAELTSGAWVLTTVDQKAYNGTTLTKWNGSTNEVGGELAWKDMLDIIHTVNSGFKWQAPPQQMQPGSYLNLEAIYTNVDYATSSNVKTGIKMFIDKAGADYKVTNEEAIEILKVNKDNKQYANEVKKGFFSAPKTLFDETNQCQLIVDCFIGKDHYVTTYTYEYRP